MDRSAMLPSILYRLFPQLHPADSSPAPPDNGTTQLGFGGPQPAIGVPQSGSALHQPGFGIPPANVVLSHGIPAPPHAFPGVRQVGPGFAQADPGFPLVGPAVSHADAGVPPDFAPAPQEHAAEFDFGSDDEVLTGNIHGPRTSTPVHEGARNAIEDELSQFSRGDATVQQRAEFSSRSFARYAHPYKTAICDSYAAGYCRYGSKCRYAHGHPELKPRGNPHPKFKTQLCSNFSVDGSCPYDVHCHFIHITKKGMPVLKYEQLVRAGLLDRTDSFEDCEPVDKLHVSTYQTAYEQYCELLSRAELDLSHDSECDHPLQAPSNVADDTFQQHAAPPSNANLHPNGRDQVSEERRCHQPHPRRHQQGQEDQSRHETSQDADDDDRRDAYPWIGRQLTSQEFDELLRCRFVEALRAQSAISLPADARSSISSRSDTRPDPLQALELDANRRPDPAERALIAQLHAISQQHRRYEADLGNTYAEAVYLLWNCSRHERSRIPPHSCRDQQSDQEADRDAGPCTCEHEQKHQAVAQLHRARLAELRRRNDLLRARLNAEYRRARQAAVESSAQEEARDDAHDASPHQPRQEPEVASGAESDTRQDPPRPPQRPHQPRQEPEAASPPPRFINRDGSTWKHWSVDVSLGLVKWCDGVCAWTPEELRIQAEAAARGEYAPRADTSRASRASRHDDAQR